MSLRSQQIVKRKKKKKGGGGGRRVKAASAGRARLLPWEERCWLQQGDEERELGSVSLGRNPIFSVLSPSLSLEDPGSGQDQAV